MVLGFIFLHGGSPHQKADVIPGVSKKGFRSKETDSACDWMSYVPLSLSLSLALSVYQFVRHTMGSV